MTTTSTGSKPVSTRRNAPALAIAVAVVIAIAACTVDAYAALAAGADSSFAPLRPAIYAPFVVVGIVAAYLGWRIINRRAVRPGAVLRVLVPVLAVLSLVPDGILLATGFIPGTSLTGVAALAIMHVIVVAVAVPLCLRISPIRSSATGRVIR